MAWLQRIWRRAQRWRLMASAWLMLLSAAVALIGCIFSNNINNRNGSYRKDGAAQYEIYQACRKGE